MWLRAGCERRRTQESVLVVRASIDLYELRQPKLSSIGFQIQVIPISLNVSSCNNPRVFVCVRLFAICDSPEQ